MQQNNSYLYKATVAAALGGLLFGYDTAVIAGAIGFLKIKYDLNPTMEGWVTSCALVGCIIGAMFSGILSDKIGRKKTLMICALLFGISSVGTGMSELNGFIFFRIMAGIAIGTASMVSPMYISEISPAEKRGGLVSINQLGVVTGILVIYFVNAYIAGLYDEAWNISTGWRWMFASGSIPSIIFFITLLSVPESPRWLAKQGQWADAENILSRINGKEKASSAITEIKNALKEEPESFGEIFKPGLRLALFIGTIAYFIGLWNADMELSEKGYYFTVLLFGLFSAISVQKAVRDQLEGIPVTNLYYGIAWFTTLLSIVLLTVGLWNAELAKSEKGFYAMSFVLSLFAAIAVQKNTRDMKAFKATDTE